MTLLNKQTVLEHLYKRLIETANNNVGFECDAGIVFEEIATDRIKTWLDEVQTVDAVPVIRCKDCRYWLPHTQFGYDADWGEYHNYCEKHLPDDEFYAFIKEADDFCSWAERKEE